MRRSVGARETAAFPRRHRPPPGSLAQLGEDVAAAFLERRGGTVTARNVCVGSGEIDLLVSFDAGLVAVEVKTIGPNATATDPIDRLTGDKRRQVRSLVALLNRRGLDRSGLGRTGDPETEGRVDRIDFVGVRVSASGVYVNWRTGVA